jgi:hypothetical protein
MSYGAQQKFSDKCEDVVTKSWAGAYDNAATEVAAHVLKARPQEADTPYPFEKYIRGCLAHQIEMVDNRLTMRFVEGHIDRAYLNNCATEGERGVVCDLIREGIAALGVVDLNLVVYEINGLVATLPEHKEIICQMDRDYLAALQHSHSLAVQAVTTTPDEDTSA